jgi:hypothetical protein
MNTVMLQLATNMHGVNDDGQTKAHTAESLIPEGFVEIEFAI